MKKLHIINILFIIFSINSVAMDKQEEENNILTQSSNKITFRTPWSCKKEVQKLIQGNYENAQFEIKQEPIEIDKLNSIILSFINGELYPSYIIIGIKEERMYNYYIMSKDDFDKLNIAQGNGIYKVTHEEKDIEYYQMIFGQKEKLTLNETPPKKKNSRKPKDINSLENGVKISQGTAKEFFKKVKENPIDSSNIFNVKFPITVGKKEKIIYDNIESYIKNIEFHFKTPSWVYIGNLQNKSKIELESYVKCRIIKPYINNGLNAEILIIKISPHLAGLVKFKEQDPIFIRKQEGSQTDYGSHPIKEATPQGEKLRQKLFNLLKNLCNDISSNSINKFKEYFSYESAVKEMLDDKGNTLLMLTVQAGNKDLVSYLIGFYANKSDLKNEKNIENENALLIAARMNNIEMIELLLHDAPILNQYQGQAFLVACKYNSWKVAEYFLTNFDHQKASENALTKDDIKNGMDIIDKLETCTDECKNIKRLISDILYN